MKIRPAIYEDCAFVFKLAMEPTVRSVSTRQESFSYTQHGLWWDRRFAETTTRIWIAEKSDGPIAYVRYGSGEPAKSGDAEVSIAVLPSERGHGVGLKLLTGTETDAKRLLNVDRIKALVGVKNIASQKLFESAGYRLVKWEERMGKQHRVYIK